MQLLNRGISMEDEHLDTTLKQKYSTEEAISQEQVALDLETLRGIEEKKTKKSKITLILRIFAFPFLILMVLLYLLIFPCMEEEY
jgi:hypothetical protein